jgi:hypothetical protein
MGNESCIADIYKNTVFDLRETVQAQIYIIIYIRLTFGRIESESCIRQIAF